MFNIKSTQLNVKINYKIYNKYVKKISEFILKNRSKSMLEAKKVLIVDDENKIVSVVKSYLEMERSEEHTSELQSQ